VALRTKLFYGAGSIAFGVKDNGFQTFLLLFYSQLVGLAPDAVSGAIFVALLVDAFMDPIIGQVSDHWRSRWGRRHPFMYAAAIPVSLSYLALWNPPHWSHEALFYYLLVTAIVVRTFITFFEIPSSALVAEFTDNYDQRTALLGYRYAFGWGGGLGMVLLAYLVFLTPTKQYPTGTLNPVGYAHYGFAAAAVMFAAILVSAIGTHDRIPFLRQPSGAPRSLPDLAREMIATLSNRSFLPMLGVAAFSAMGQGVSFALSLYFATFLWELNSKEISLLVIQGFFGALAAAAFAPVISKRIGKKAAALITLTLGILIGIMPVSLRLAGVFPANHTAALVPALMGFGIFSSTLGISASILISSMIADVVEDSELRTGRRSEGLFFAANGFIAKAVSGTGLLFAGMMLKAAHFPAGAKPGQVPWEVIRHLVMLYVPIYAGLYLVAIGILSFYRISRATHQDNLRRLADAAAAAETYAEEGAPAAPVGTGAPGA
jgi:Na+/melibiose symporter-like transporter